MVRRLKLVGAAQAEAEAKLASRSSDLTQMTAQHEAVAHQLEAMTSRYASLPAAQPTARVCVGLICRMSQQQL